MAILLASVSITKSRYEFGSASTGALQSDYFSCLKAVRCWTPNANIAYFPITLVKGCAIYAKYGIKRL